MLFEMVNKNILLSDSMLRQTVILVTRNAPNITQSNLQYTVTKIVTTIQCKLAWFNVKAKKLWITINSVSNLVLLAGFPQVCILCYSVEWTSLPF